MVEKTGSPALSSPHISGLEIAPYARPPDRSPPLLAPTSRSTNPKKPK